MPIIRKQLKPSDVYPTDIRYNTSTGHVQSLINGTWTDNPLADPRTQTTIPGNITAHPACDAAESVKVAFKAQIDGVLTAIAGSQSAFTIAGIILSLFTFGVFGIFISLALLLAHAMLDAGTISINAALTTTVYDTFTCILYCHMDNATGQLIAGSLPEVESDIDGQIGGLGATILKAMLSLAGEGGVNNIAGLGTSTGDCSDCDCTTPCDIDNWSVYSGTEVSRNATTGHIICDAVLDAGLYGGYGLIYQSSDNDLCCHIDYEVLSGAVTIALNIQCGNDAYPTHSFSGGGGANELRSFLLASNVPFQVNMHFTP